MAKNICILTMIHCAVQHINHTIYIANYHSLVSALSYTALSALSR